MYFLNPHLLDVGPNLAMILAAVVVTLLVALQYKRTKKVQSAFGAWDLLQDTSKPLSRGRYVARAAFASIAAALLMLALAEPVIPNGKITIAKGTLDVVAVVDVSRSMAAMDYPGKVPSSAVPQPLIEDANSDIEQASEEAGSRLEMVRHILLDSMLAQLDNNQIGVVSYAGEAFPQAFLGSDMTALRWVIKRGLTINSAPGEGSAMGKALMLSLDLFNADSPPDHEKLIVLFSDGGNDDDVSLLNTFATQARQRGVKLVVVGLGNVMPSKIPVSKLAADDDYAQSLRQHGTKWYEENGQEIKTGMDAALLQGLANRAGGEYIHLQDASDLNLLKYVGRTSLESVSGTMQLFPYALCAALVFIALAFGVTHRWPWRKQS